MPRAIAEAVKPWREALMEFVEEWEELCMNELSSCYLNAKALLSAPEQAGEQKGEVKP